MRLLIWCIAGMLMGAMLAVAKSIRKDFENWLKSRKNLAD
jgi:hypothetical protein